MTSSVFNVFSLTNDYPAEILIRVGQPETNVSQEVWEQKRFCLNKSRRANRARKIIGCGSARHGPKIAWKIALSMWPRPDRLERPRQARHRFYCLRPRGEACGANRSSSQRRQPGAFCSRSELNWPPIDKHLWVYPRWQIAPMRGFDIPNRLWRT